MSRSDVVRIDPSLLPKSNRLHVGDHYVKLGQPKSRTPIVWNFGDHLKFLQFLGYWLRKGYYDRYAVSIATGKDLPELFPSIDYVAQLFTCHYKVRGDKVVKFDSAMLKYVMLGFGFAKKQKETIPVIPFWVTNLGSTCKLHFLRGYFTASATLNNEYIKFKHIDALRAHEMMYDIAGDISYWITDKDLYIPADGMQKFKEGIGLLSQQKTLELDQIIFTNHL